MKSGLAEHAKYILPPFLMEIAGIMLRRSTRFTGDYTNWEEAKAKATGYEAQDVLDHACRTMREVRSHDNEGKLGSNFIGQKVIPFPIISALLTTALANQGSLSVLDLGGGLGGTYIRSKDFLKQVKDLKWTIVEQPHFVTAGQDEFSDGILSFFPTLDAAWASQQPNIILLSGILQYLPNPYQIIAQIIGYLPKCIVLDRTPITRSNREMLCIQHTPAQVIKASYPAWLFSRSSLLSPFEQYYKLRAEFDAIDGTLGFGRYRSDFKGFIFLEK